MGNNLIYMRRRLGIMAQPHKESKAGDLVTFTGIKAPLSVLAQIVPVQSGSGDPSPENVRPITGWTGCKVNRTGVNMWDEEWELGRYDTATGAKVMASDRIRCKNPIRVNANTDYRFVGTDCVVYWYDRYDNFISYSTPSAGDVRTSPSRAYYMRFNAYSAYGTTYNHDISINYPATDTSYHAYSGTTLPVNWQSTAGTVYGGSLQINKDGTGVLTATKEIATPTTWSMASMTSCFYVDRQATDGTAGETLCNMYQYGAIVTGANYAKNYPRTICVQALNGIRFCVYEPNYETADAFNTFISNNPIQIVYPLASPVTYNLTSQQVGQLLANNGVNNVWSNANGQITVNYWKH